MSTTLTLEQKKSLLDLKKKYENTKITSKSFSNVDRGPCYAGGCSSTCYGSCKGNCQYSG